MCRRAVSVKLGTRMDGEFVGTRCTNRLHDLWQLIRVVVSQSDLISQRMYDPSYAMHAVAGSVLAFDYPELISSIEMDDVGVLNPVDGRGEILDEDTLVKIYEQVKEDRQNKGMKLMDYLTSQNEDPNEIILAWLNK